MTPTLKEILIEDLNGSTYQNNENLNDILDNIRLSLSDKSYSDINTHIIREFSEIMGSNAPYPNPYYPPPTGSKTLQNVAKHYMCYFGNLWLSHKKYYPDKVADVLGNNRVVDAPPEERDRIRFEVSCEINDTMWMMRIIE